MPESEQPEPTGRTVGDVVHIATKAGLSAIPIVGGPAAEIFAAIVQPPLERRRNEWIRDLGDRIEQLEKEGRIHAEELQHNEPFVDTALQATTIALRNHQGEKREALRNAVLNAALPGAPAADLQHFFLGLVDQFTTWHLRILRSVGAIQCISFRR
jgi:hypothetical protein